MVLKKNNAVIYFTIVLVFILVCNFLILKTFKNHSVKDHNIAALSGIIVTQSDNDMVKESVSTIAANVSTESAAKATTKANNKPKTKKTNAKKTNVNKNYNSPYVITVYLKSQSVIVRRSGFDGKSGDVVKQFVCSSGLPYSPTPVGKFNLIRKFRWRLLQGNVYGQYCSTITGNILFHSVPYLKKDPSTLKNEEYDKLGRKASMGCIRLSVRDSKWIYDNAPNGTPVSIVDEEGPYGFSAPKRKPDMFYNGWDPTDKWSEGNPYFNDHHESETTASESTSVSESTQISSSTAVETSLTSAESTSATSAVSTSVTAATTLATKMDISSGF